MIISKTPLRVSFFGGGTDIPEYFHHNGGAVIGSAIDKYIYHSVFRFPSELFPYNTRISYSKVECVRTLDEIEHLPYREILRANKIYGDVELNVSSDLPSFSGLGSSSSFSVGLIKVLNAYKGLHINKESLAKEAIRIEREILKEAVGLQDQVFAAYGGFNVIQFKKDSSFTVEPVSISNARLEELANSLVMFFTGITRRAQNLEKDKISNMSSIRGNLDNIFRTVEIAHNLLTNNSSLSEFGRLLDSTWKEKKMLSSGVTNDVIDSIYKRAMENGALGGKLLGAGGGGFLLFFVPPERKSFLRAALKDLYEIKFNLNSSGSSIINS